MCICLGVCTLLPAQDQHAISYLRAFCENNMDKFQKYRALFLDTAPALMDNLRNNLIDSNFAQLAAEVHGFGTKFMMFGMQSANELSQQIELLCRNGTPNPIKIESAVRKLINLVETAITEVNQDDTHA